MTIKQVTLIIYQSPESILYVKNESFEHEKAMEFDKMITVNGATYKAKVKHLCVSGNIFVKLKLVK